MYIDLIIFIILIAVVFIFFRKFSSIVYAIFIIDLTLRALTYIKWNINLLYIIFMFIFIGYLVRTFIKKRK